MKRISNIMFWRKSEEKKAMKFVVVVLALTLGALLKVVIVDVASKGVSNEIFVVQPVQAQENVYVATPPGSPSMEVNIDRPGMDYKDFDLSEARPELCREACANDTNCKAYTYVNPEVQGPQGRCWLKSGVPNPVQSQCCVSGIKQLASSAVSRRREGGTFSSDCPDLGRLSWGLAGGEPILRDPPVLGRFLTVDFSQAKLQLYRDCHPQQRFLPVPSFTWQILKKPSGSGAILANVNTLTPRLWVDKGGTYVIRFIACPHGCTLSNGDRVDAISKDSPPLLAYSTKRPKSIRFVLNGFEILNTMAPHEDTDFVFLTAKAGNDIVGQRSEKIGDLNNGNYALNWDVGSISLNQLVVVSYQIVNKGHGDADKAVAAGTNIARALAAVGTALGITSAGVLAAVGPVLDLILANCDGVVLSDNVFVADPNLWTGRPFFSQTRSYTGPDTPHGCGTNARYKVTFTVIPEWEPERPLVMPYRGPAR